MRKVAGALAAGCSITIKPSEETPATAIAIGQALMELACQRVFSILFLACQPRYPNIFWVNDTRIQLYRKCSGWYASSKLAANNLIRCTMELGGHSPVMVFKDADIDAAAQFCAAGNSVMRGKFDISTDSLLKSRCMTYFWPPSKNMLRRLM